MDSFFVLTGGPGSGKSSLVTALADAGHAHSPEAGRAIIQAQVAIGGQALPWVDPLAFAELMLSWDIRSHDAARSETGPIFFDRGVPDVLGYLHLQKLTVPVHMENAAARYRYNRRVFIAPPWEEIFSQDSERKQDFAEAVRTFESMAATYTRLGYELIELPRAPLEERVSFVLEAIGASPSKQASPTGTYL